MPMLDRDGTNIFYEVTGPEGGEVPVLLTHGYSASAAMWDVNLPALSKDRQVITWDIRGHARSDSPDDPALYTEGLSVDDMGAILDFVGVERAVVGGLSLGGYLSLAFNIRFPHRVAALMLFDTGPGYRRQEGRDQWNNGMVERSATNYEERGLAALSSSPEVVASASRHRDPLGLARAARGIMAQFDSRVIDSLPTISVPTLIVVGANDTAFLASADVMEAKIPEAKKVVLDDAGHAANIDQPEAFDEAVLEFLSRI
jgi:pimeloyl-ACP methyl ester carboxylesterase